MEFVIAHIDFNATKFQVQKAIEDVLHGPDLYDPDDPKNKGRVPNFIVQLNESDIGRLHNGSGFLTLPSNDLATRFERWFRDPANKKTGIRVLNRKMHFSRSPRKIYPQKRQILENAMYIGPEQEEKRESILAETSTQLRVARVQFGVWHRPPTPKGGKIPDRIFSVEYERDYSVNSAAYLEVNYEHKCIRIEVCASCRCSNAERIRDSQCF